MALHMSLMKFLYTQAGFDPCLFVASIVRARVCARRERQFSTRYVPVGKAKLACANPQSHDVSGWGVVTGTS